MSFYISPPIYLGEQINRRVQIIGHKDDTFKVECAKKCTELLNEASHVQIILSWISFSLKVVSAKMSLLQMLLRQEEETRSAQGVACRES